MKKIVLVAHCILNTCSKVVMEDSPEMQAEMECRRQLILLAANHDLQLIQLPCPEFTLYGPKRWGHVKNQFDNVFFRKHCKEILEGPLMELDEYLKDTNRFQVLGIIGVEGSPSCGVGLTYTGPWGGSMETGSEWAQIVDECFPANEPGVMIDVLARELQAGNRRVPVMGLKPETIDFLKKELGVE